MRRSFIETQIFVEEWQAAGLTDEDLRGLQRELLLDSDVGTVITGACGIRKVRIKGVNKGKRGGGRVIYKDYPKFQYLVLFYMYRKADKVDLTTDEKKAICVALKRLESISHGLYQGRGSKR